MDIFFKKYTHVKKVQGASLTLHVKEDAKRYLFSTIRKKLAFFLKKTTKCFAQQLFLYPPHLKACIHRHFMLSYFLTAFAQCLSDFAQ